MVRFGTPAVAAAILLSAAGASAQVVVNPVSGRVSIRASGQPVSTILDQIAQKTGMTVEYEKNPPRQGVTLAVEDRTPAQAVVAVLEGLNIPYALSLTPDGIRVQTLVLTDSAPPPKGASPRVGRETSMAQPEEPPEVPSDQTPGDGTPVDVPEQAQVVPAEPQQRRAPPEPPPVTLAPAFPNSPFGAVGGGSGTDVKVEAPVPEQPPQPPQVEKEPQV